MRLLRTLAPLVRTLRMLPAFVAFLVVIVTFPAAAATQPRLDAETVIDLSEAAIGRTVGNHVLTDSKGAPLPIESFRGRPLVISLVYTSCSSVCPVTTQHVMQAVRKARKVTGEGSFAVLTFGFDARNDTPAQLAAFASTQGINLDDWTLASADAATVEALLEDVGFTYAAAAGGFEHITQTTILDAEGKVYRHVYGDTFPDQVFIEPLKELVFGTTVRSFAFTDLVDRIRFICTVYNPGSRAYQFDYAIFFGITIGGLSLILSGFVVFRLWRTNQRLLAARNQKGQG